jgi:preprotein translocase SecE subunit
MNLATPFRLVVQYLQGSYKEFRQTTWPSRDAIIRYTILVTVTIVLSAVILTGFDYGMKQLTDRFLIR